MQCKTQFLRYLRIAISAQDQKKRGIIISQGKVKIDIY